MLSLDFGLVYLAVLHMVAPDVKRALVVVDMQIDFSGSGKLGTGASMDPVISVVNRVIQNHNWQVCEPCICLYVFQHRHSI